MFVSFQESLPKPLKLKTWISSYTFFFFLIIKNKSICDRITSLNCLTFHQTTHISVDFFSLQNQKQTVLCDKHGQSKSNENLGNRLTLIKSDRPLSRSTQFFHPRSLFSGSVSPSSRKHLHLAVGLRELRDLGLGRAGHGRAGRGI